MLDDVCSGRLRDGGCPVAGSVVDDEDIGVEVQADGSHNRPDRLFLVQGRDDNQQLGQNRLLAQRCHVTSAVRRARVNRVSVIIVAYGADPWLEQSVEAALASSGVDVDVVVVDNGCTDGAVARLEGRLRVHVVKPGRNLGFAGGCNAGVAAAAGAFVALVNPDALVAPPALQRLVEVAARTGVGIATASVRLADRPDHLNSAGNDIHFSGMSWSGCFDEPASRYDDERPVIAASGAAMALRRALWEDLSGFDDEFFAYYEDADLSLRCRQRGHAVIYVPEAVVVHRYEFSRNAGKFFLLERNRTLMVLTCFSSRLLALVAPVLIAIEAATLGMGVANGWWREKVRSWRWLIAHRGHVVQRRRAVQAARTVPDRALADMLAVRLRPGNLPPPRWLLSFDVVLTAYWRLARRLL